MGVDTRIGPRSALLFATVSAALVGPAPAPPAAPEAPKTPSAVPDFNRIDEDLRRVAELRRSALASWNHGRPAEALAAVESMIALSPKLREDRDALGKYLAQLKRFEEARKAPRFLNRQLGAGDVFGGSLVGRYEDILRDLSVQEVTTYELLAALSEARGDLSAAARSWGDVVRFNSEKLGAGHWLVDGAQREVDRVNRVAALPAARARLIEGSIAATAALVLLLPDSDVTEIKTPGMTIKKERARRDRSRQLGSTFCIDSRGYFVAGAGAVMQGKQGQRTTTLERDRGILTGTKTTIEREEWGPMRIVCRAGHTDERALPARVIWVDEASGLALLKVSSAEPLPYLQLARRAPAKGDWACLLGLPKAPRAEELTWGVSYPGEPLSIAILRADAMRIDSCHLQKGRPWLITLGSPPPPVSSGGLTGAPVLDDDGRVLGVLIEGLSGTDTHYVIPAARLAELLEKYRGRAEVLFDTPPLVFSERKLPVEWTFEVARFEPLLAGAVVEVIINPRSARRRTFVASPGQGGLFTARVVPVDPGEPDPVDVLVAGPTEPVRVMDREVSLGGERLRLSNLRWIEIKASPHGYTVDGRRLSGNITGLGPLEGRRGTEAVTIDPIGAGPLTIEYPPTKVDPVLIEIVVRGGGRDLGRLEASIPYSEPRIPLFEPKGSEGTGPRWSGPALGPATTAIGPARIVASKEIPTKFAPSSPVAKDDGPLVCRLDGTIDRSAVGGGGRYLLLKLKDRRRVDVFDTTDANIVASLPLASDDALIAAGAEKAIVVYPSLGFIHHFDLTTARLEATAAVPVPGRINGISMGYDSHGPLLTTWTPRENTGELGQRWFSLLDAGTLKVVPLDSAKSSPETFGPVQPRPGVFQVRDFKARSDVVAMRASAGGDLYGLWRLSSSPSGVETLALRGRSLELTYLHEEAGALVPGPDGQTIFAERGGMRDASGKALTDPPAPAPPDPEVLVPAIGSPFFLGVRGLSASNAPKEARPIVAMIHLTPAGEAPLAVIELDEMQERGAANPAGVAALTPDQRFFWLPAANLLITIPATRDRLVVRRLDLRAALDRLGIDGMFAASPGLLTVPAGLSVNARIRVISRDEKTVLSLVSGPDGLLVSPDGTIDWRPPAQFAGRDLTVKVVAANGAGRQAEFTLTLRVR